jgi:hypothetical protein
LPRDASRDFGKIMMDVVLPGIMHYPEDPMFERATIARNGTLTKRFSYLQVYVDGNKYQ